MSIEEEIHRSFRTLDAPPARPDPVRRVEAGVRRRLRRRHTAVAVSVVVLVGLAASAALAAMDRAYGEGLHMPAAAQQWRLGGNRTALWIAGLVTIVGLVLARGPVRPAAVGRFCERHTLLKPADTMIHTYLVQRRRWRWLGVTVALASQLVTSPPGRLDVSFAVVAGGLLAGALVGEWRFRALTHPTVRTAVSGTVTGVLLGVAVVAVAVTLGLPHLTDVPGDAQARGWIAAAVAVTTAAAVHTVPRPGRGRPDEATAIVASGVHWLSAYGIAAALLLLGQAFGITGSRMQGFPMAQPLGILAAVLGVAALVLAAALARGGWQREWTTRLSRPSLQVAVVSIVGLVVSAAVLATGLLNARPPFDASAPDARATIIVSDYDHMAAAAAALGTDELPNIFGTDQVYGRLDLRTPPGASDRYDYYFVIVDASTDTPTADMAGAGGSVWGHPLSFLPRHYPWLSAFDAPSGGALSMDTDEAGPIFFTATFPYVEISADRLFAALVLVDDQGVIFWATRVPLTTLELPAD